MDQKEFEKEWHNEEDYVICRTSGSTGIPKEIRLEKEFMRSSAERTNEFFCIDSASRLHTCLDFEYIASKMMTVRAEIGNCKLTSENPSNRPLLDIKEDETITLLSVVPSQMFWILDNAGNMPEITNILIGGSAIPTRLRRLISLSGMNVWESYGMTETASHIALRKVDEDSDIPFETLPGISVEASAEGCLVINMPGKDKLETTDLADIVSPTQFRILGRADNCIISGGVKIIPEMLESTLGGFIAFDYCVSSVSDPKWGERLVLVVEKGNSLLDDEVIKKAVGVRLDQYKKTLNLGIKSPKEIIVLDSFPRGNNGKIDRKAIRLKIS